MPYKQPFTSNLLLEAQLEAAISDVLCADVQAFGDDFDRAAKSAEDSGAYDIALAFRLFAALVSFHFVPGDRAEPFSNMIGFADGTRTLVGSDLDASDIAALRGVVETLQIVPLKTRIADLIWSRQKREVACARLAIDGYTEMLKGLLSGTYTLRFEDAKATSVSSQEFLSRGLLIARSTGWNRSENNELKEVAAHVLGEAFEEGGVTFVRFGRLVHEAGLVEAIPLLGRTNELVDRALQEADFHGAEELQRLYIAFELRGRSERSKPDLYLKLASILEDHADHEDSALMKMHCLQRAIDSLHGVQGVRTERDRLHRKLKDVQIHIHDEFTPVSHSISIQPEIERIINGFEELDLLDSLRRLTFVEMPADPEDLFAKAREEMKRAPLSSLFSSTIIDGKGRVKAKSEGGGDFSPDAVRHKILQHQDIRINIAVEAAIRPIRQHISERHSIGLSPLTELCRLSPFVSSGHEHIIARGLQAFLYGDDQIAATCLVPTLESGLRQLVAAAGRADTSISLGGIEQTVGLGLIISNHRDVLEKVFGIPIVFAIENLFVHPLGPNIRNELCHGLTSDMQFFSPNYIYACKLIFSLVMLPLVGDDWEKVKARAEAARF